MKRLFVLSLFACCSLLSFAQRPDVDFVTLGADEFTGEYKVQTALLNISKGRGNNLWMAFYYKEGNYYLFTATHLYDAFTIDSGDILYLRFADGSVAETHATEYQVSTPHNSPYVIPFTINMTYTTDRQTIQNVVDKSLQKVRVYINNGKYFEIEPKPNMVKELRNYASEFLRATRMHDKNFKN